MMSACARRRCSAVRCNHTSRLPWLVRRGILAAATPLYIGPKGMLNDRLHGVFELLISRGYGARNLRTADGFV